MKKITLNKIKATILAIFTLLFSFSPYLTEMVKADSVDIAIYEDRFFYGRSAPEVLRLSCDCESVSFYATCAEGETDELTAFIINMSSGAVDTYDFEANGVVDTLFSDFEAGYYKIYIIGSSVEKLRGLVVFTDINPLIAE